MLSPSFVSAASALAPSRLTRRWPPSFECSSDSIFPTCSVIPVNIVKISLGHEIVPASLQRNIFERGRLWKPARGNSRHGHAARPHDFGSIEENHFVHNTGLQCGAIQVRPGFEQNIQNVAAAECAEDSAQVHMAAA